MVIQLDSDGKNREISGRIFGQFDEILFPWLSNADNY